MTPSTNQDTLHQLERRPTRAGQPTLDIVVSTGVGSGPTKLAAFDAALAAAGVANYNLIRLSSVIPAEAKIIAAPPNWHHADGKWGDRLYVVMADCRVSNLGTEAWAGIGWTREPESGRGLFVEHEGHSEHEVAASIDASLRALATNRPAYTPGDIQSAYVGIECRDEPVCAVAVATYGTESWQPTAIQL